MRLLSYIRVPAKVSRCGLALLDQQMWCWGCDIRRSDGNLLLAYGAEKRPSPDPREHSAYSFHLPDGMTLNLWGWGVWVAREGFGSLLLSRSRFRVRYTSEVVLMPDAWRENDLPDTDHQLDDHAHSMAYHLLAQTMHWMSNYERWVLTQSTPTYRRHVTNAWPQRKHYRGGVPPDDVPQQWQTLAQILYEENPT
jgi:hypothetical protein